MNPQSPGGKTISVKLGKGEYIVPVSAVASATGSVLLMLPPGNIPASPDRFRPVKFVISAVGNRRLSWYVRWELGPVLRSKPFSQEKSL